MLFYSLAFPKKLRNTLNINNNLIFYLKCGRKRIEHHDYPTLLKFFKVGATVGASKSMTSAAEAASGSTFLTFVLLKGCGAPPMRAAGLIAKDDWKELEETLQ